MTKDEAFAAAFDDPHWIQKSGAECPRCARMHSFVAPDGTEICPPCWYIPPEVPKPEPPKPVRKGYLESGVNNLFREDLTILAGTYLDAEEQGKKEDQGGRTSAMKRELIRSQPPLIDLMNDFPDVQRARGAVAERRVTRDSPAWALNEEIADERNAEEENKAFMHYVCTECGVLDRTTLREKDEGRKLDGKRVCPDCWTLAFAPGGRLYGTTVGAQRCRRDTVPYAVSFDD